MSPFPVRYLPSPTPDAVARWAAGHAGPGDVVVALFAAAEEQRFRATPRLSDQIDPSLVAGLFPGVVAGRRRHDDGAIVLALPAETEPTTVDLSDRRSAASRPDRFGSDRSGRDPSGSGAPNGPTPALFSDLSARPAGAEKPPSAPTVLTFVDGCASGLDPFTRLLRDRVATGRVVLGAGAGRPDRSPGPCLMVDGRLREQAAVLVPLRARSEIDVRHGWRRLAGPVVATRTDGAVVHRLNWEPAAAVYRRLLNEHGASADVRAAPGAPVAFPFGLMQQGEKDLVRQPVALRPDGSIVCGGAVPQHALLHILTGTEQGRSDAAAQAPSRAEMQARWRNGSGPDAWFVARSMNPASPAETESGAEIAPSITGSEEISPAPVGVQSVGQIASVRRRTVTWLNGTTVVGALQRCGSA